VDPEIGTMSDLASGPPPVPPALVDWLEKVFQDRFPDVPENQPIVVERVARVAGRLDVVRLLRAHLTRQSGQQPTPTTPKRRKSSP
jgi:hypothetical protein